jgi:hypothetical protein
MIGTQPDDGQRARKRVADSEVREDGTTAAIEEDVPRLDVLVDVLGLVGQYNAPAISLTMLSSGYRGIGGLPRTNCAPDPLFSAAYRREAPIDGCLCKKELDLIW